MTTTEKNNPHGFTVTKSRGVMSGRKRISRKMMERAFEWGYMKLGRDEKPERRLGIFLIGVGIGSPCDLTDDQEVKILTCILNGRNRRTRELDRFGRTRTN